jgi:glyoxylase-like metal-dependent hydrolase (beta-lactamase superfamily II)
MSREAAARVASGQAAEEVVRHGADEGLSWSGAPRADLVFEPGEALQAGPFVVETMALPGHTRCGAGYRVRELDVLAVGDYLSVVEFPFVYASTTAYRATLAALSELLRHDPVAHVVPGHGRPLSGREALDVAEADLAYLRALRDAVRGALAAGASRDDAIAAGAAVEVPRGADDGGDGRLRRDNGELQLSELAPAA